MTNSRVAALRRARERQSRIEAATARATRAQAALERAIKARLLAAERHDERVRDAEDATATEAAGLARVCGSAEAAAEILGWSVRHVRSVLKAEHERASGAPGTRTPRTASLLEGGGNGVSPRGN
ncbi:hypothetical protein GCM10010530_57640 [Kribbella aluminosa]